MIALHPRTAYRLAPSLTLLALLASGCAGVGNFQKPEVPAVASAKATAPRPQTPVTEQASTHEIAQVGFQSPACESCQVDACATDGQECSPCVPCQAPPQGYVMALQPQPWRYDPQEFLCDGGDQDPAANLGRGNQFLGLQPEDTVAHYTTEAGQIEMTASNRVCLYAPRFGNIRRITGAVANDGAIGAGGMVRPVGPVGVNMDLPGLVMTDTTEIRRAEVTRRIDSMRDRNRGVPVERIQQVNLAAHVWEALAGIQNVSLTEIDESQWVALQRYAVAATTWAIDESVEVEIQDLAPPVLTRDERVDALVVYDFPDAGRLNLIKLANKQHAQIGEEVEFALRLQNVGDSSVSGVVVTDNLTTRLEYVADSQECSIESDFELQANQANSSQLIWRLKETLEVGQSVTITFKCRVR